MKTYLDGSTIIESEFLAQQTGFALFALFLSGARRFWLGFCNASIAGRVWGYDADDYGAVCFLCMVGMYLYLESKMVGRSEVGKETRMGLLKGVYDMRFWYDWSGGRLTSKRWNTGSKGLPGTYINRFSLSPRCEWVILKPL